MHFSWNFIQGVIFPFQGSGTGLNSVFLIKGNDVDIWPEASFGCYIEKKGVNRVTTEQLVDVHSRPASHQK